MSNLTSYPLVDAFETLLSQSWDWNIGRVYLDSLPDITFPAWVTTYIGVDMQNSLRQVGRINNIDTANSRVYVSSIAVNKSPGVAYSAQSHGVHAKVIIGDNYQFWEDIANTFLTKVNTNDSTMFIWYYATLAARDAAIPSPVSGKYSAFTLEEWIWRDYDSSGWSARQWGTTVNATEALAGKLQAVTLTMLRSGTRTGSTWAVNAVTPDYISQVIQEWYRLYAGTNATGNDSYSLNLAPALAAYTTGMRVGFKADVANTWACSLALNGLVAKSIKTYEWNDPANGDIAVGSIVNLTYDGTNWILPPRRTAATSSQIWAWTNTSAYVTPAQLASMVSPKAGTSQTASSWVTSGNTTSTSYVKLFQWTIWISWTYTVSFTVTSASWSGSNAYGRIYKNWVAFGTQAVANGSWGWPGVTNSSEDLTFAEGETIEVRARTDATGTPQCGISAFLLRYDLFASLAAVTMA